MNKDELRKEVIQRIKNATVKIIVNGEFSGTGFAITKDGFYLTAYHCIVGNPTSIEIVTPYGEKISALLDEHKSLISEKYDLAVLRTDHKPSSFLPLGKAESSYDGDNVVAIGYPAAHIENNGNVGTYHGRISRWRNDQRIELANVVQGKGHSGSPVVTV